MDDVDGQVPAPRRALGRRRPSPSGRPVPAPAPEPRVADLSALLADIDALRTTLSTDLSLAAAALEAGADDLAAQVVGNDLHEVRDFEARALRHLASLDEPAAAAAASTPVATAAADLAPAVPLRRRRLLAAAPLVAAAAAVVGLFAGVVPSSTPVPGSATSIDGLSEAGYSLAMLSELAEQGASTDELRDAASELNEELEDLVAANDPLAARQALLLLEAGAQVLGTQPDQGPLREVLARTRELERALRRVLPGASGSPSLPSVSPLPVVPRPASAQPSPAETRPASRPAGSPSPTGTTSPRPTTSPAPSTPPSTAPRPTTTPSPTPSSSPTAPDTFPQPTLPDDGL